MTTQTAEQVLFGNPPSDSYKPKKSELKVFLEETAAEAQGRVFTSLVLGQSNARGIGGSTGGDQSASPLVELWNSNASGSTYAQGNAFNVAAFGTAPLNIGSSGAWANNLGFHFAKAMGERTGNRQYQIQVAMGGHAVEAFIRNTDLSTNGWTRDVSDENLNAAMKTALAAAMPQVPGAPTKLNAVIIHQGEANLGEQVELFARKWIVVLQDLKDTGWIDEQTVIVFGELCPVPENTYALRHLNALRRIQMDWPNVKIARSVGLTSFEAANVHFSGESLAKFGARYADAAMTAQEPHEIEAIGGDLSVDAGLAWATSGGSTNTTNFDYASRLPRVLNGVPAIIEDADLGWCYSQPANDQIILPSRRIYRVPENGVFRSTFEMKVLDDPAVVIGSPGTADCRITVYEWDEDRNYLGFQNFTPPQSPLAFADGRVVVTGTVGRAGSGADGIFTAGAKWFVPTFFAGGGSNDAAFAFNVLDMRIEGDPSPVIEGFEPHAQGANLTIASGAITVTHGAHAINTEAAAASDDLETIGTTGIPNGARLTIFPSNDTRTVVAKDGVGNLKLAGDFIMDNFYDSLTLILRDGFWVEVARADNGA
ncbi:sialate O-acetylesterase [Seohaeicola nanhaiensis]|uniref:Sialate O-acetylesterase n=1 Tax=Seohaeicola nanhaiensis TaxID=1387282 RepID=A0ABV9KH66_9RHOB